METEHCELEETGPFIRLTEDSGPELAAVPKQRENFFHNFLIPLIDFVWPVSQPKEEKLH